ncbi:MAG: DegT/DnrJ/EryC1/StrS aminotransferase family protein [Lachnospiraceae bacterium]|nr:DegT/DnrJ/EryC1/StrS aminotransferase family protein [Lachnospiraceae bacterium]
MEFRDLKAQYQHLKPELDEEVLKVMKEGNFISGYQVSELEKQLAEYVGVKHCITCGNGTDALVLALMAWNIGKGDAVFVPDFTFFASAEAPAFLGATPVFVDVESRTFNISPNELENAIQGVLKEGKLIPKAIIAVDLFGQPAEYPRILEIAKKYNLFVLEDGAQGFGGGIGEKKACSFGDIATTSFFPAKPLGCYGDGGAIFTDNDDWAELVKSYRIHGKGGNKYDNIRIGMNSRLDTMQAAILLVKLKAFVDHELHDVNTAADYYTSKLKNIVNTPIIKEGYLSSWAQYTIILDSKKQRDELQNVLKENGVPSMIYYPKQMHKQEAFHYVCRKEHSFKVTNELIDNVLALPIHPYLTWEEQEKIINTIINFFENKSN